MLLEEKLTSAGLHAKEAKVYLSLLDLGKSHLSAIAKNAHMSHVTALFHLRRLEEKKLVTRRVEGKQKYYYIHNPKQGFHFYVQQLRGDVYKKETSLMESLEGCELKYASLDNKPQVRFIQGKEVLPAIHTEVLNTPFEEMLEITNIDVAYKLVPPKRGDHRSKVRKLKSPVHSIYTTHKGKVLPAKDKNVFSYFIPKEKFDFGGEINTFGDKIILLSEDNYRGIIIKDKSMARTMQVLFKIALESTQKYNKPD